MHPHYFYGPHVKPFGYSPYPNYPYRHPHAEYYNDFHSAYPFYPDRQQPIQGQATWTEGGQVTQCGISWSDNQHMTVAVGANSPYQCGQTLKVRYPSTQRELLLTVVDRVPGYPPNRINLHRRAFEALGANTDAGVINVQIIPSPELEQEKWGKYLLEVTQAAYPTYNVKDYGVVDKTEVSATQRKETYEFMLESPQETIKVQGTVIYNPTTDRVLSFDIKEV